MGSRQDVEDVASSAMVQGPRDDAGEPEPLVLDVVENVDDDDDDDPVWFSFLLMHRGLTPTAYQHVAYFESTDG